MDTKENAGAGTEQQESGGGMFDNLPGTPQSGGETDTYSDSEPKAQEPKAQDKKGKDSAEETADTEEGTEKGEKEEGEDTSSEARAEAKPIVISGRTFKDVGELTKAYENSSREGLKLSKVSKELETEIASLKAKLYEMEEKADSKFPDEMSEEQLELLPSYKQTEYLLKKKEWEQAKAARDAERGKHKEMLGKEATRVKQAQEENSREMEADAAKYPGFKDLEATRNMVLEETPALARLPEAPYIAWLIAKGLEAVNSKSTSEEQTGKAKQEAKAKATASAGTAKAPAAKESGSDSPDDDSEIVKAYRRRTGF